MIVSPPGAQSVGQTSPCLSVNRKAWTSLRTSSTDLKNSYYVYFWMVTSELLLVLSNKYKYYKSTNIMQNTSAYEEPRSSGKWLHKYSFDPRSTKFFLCNRLLMVVILYFSVKWIHNVNHLNSKTDTNEPYYKHIKNSDIKPMIKAIDKNMMDLT